MSMQFYSFICYVMLFSPLCTHCACNLAGSPILEDAHTYYILQVKMKNNQNFVLYVLFHMYC